MRAISLCTLRAILGYFLVSVARNLLLHCSSVLRVSREGGKCSLHGKTLCWRIVLCAVTNLLQDVQNLSRVPPFNVLDPGAKRSDTSLHVPEEADQDAESEQKPIASPKLPRTSRRARSSPSDSDSHSAKKM